MLRNFLLSLSFISIATDCMQSSPDQMGAQKKSIVRRQIGWGALGAASLCLAPALAASSGALFIFEAAEASKGGKKSLGGTLTGLFFTTASAAASVYSFWRVHKLQQLKKIK